MEESKARICKAKGLMYIDVKINGKTIKAMVDNGTTHNYLVERQSGLWWILVLPTTDSDLFWKKVMERSRQSTQLLN